MSAQNDGGRAFPTGFISNGGNAGGMSLRDYLAAAALQGILMNYATEKYGVTEDTVAKYAFRYADAMLAERAKGGAK